MPTGRQSTETHWEVNREVHWEVDQSSPTDKSKAHQEAVYRDTHWDVDREVDWKVYQVNQDSIEASFRERKHDVDRMVTEADFQRRLPSQAASTSQCHYRLQDIFYRACRSTAQSSDSARTLELGKYNHCREVYVLDVDKWDATTHTWRIRSMITEGYNRCWQRKLPSMPSQERTLYHPDDSDNDLRRDMSYGNDGCCSMG